MSICQHANLEDVGNVVVTYGISGVGRRPASRNPCSHQEEVTSAGPIHHHAPRGLQDQFGPHGLVITRRYGAKICLPSLEACNKYMLFLESTGYPAPRQELLSNFNVLPTPTILYSKLASSVVPTRGIIWMLSPALKLDSQVRDSSSPSLASHTF